MVAFGVFTEYFHTSNNVSDEHKLADLLDPTLTPFFFATSVLAFERNSFQFPRSRSGSSSFGSVPASMTTPILYMSSTGQSRAQIPLPPLSLMSNSCAPGNMAWNRRVFNDLRIRWIRSESSFADKTKISINIYNSDRIPTVSASSSLDS